MLLYKKYQERLLIHRNETCNLCVSHFCILLCSLFPCALLLIVVFQYRMLIISPCYQFFFFFFHFVFVRFLNGKKLKKLEKINPFKSNIMTCICPHRTSSELKHLLFKTHMQPATYLLQIACIHVLCFFYFCERQNVFLSLV